MKKFYKLFLIIVAFMLLGTLSTYATDEEENIEASQNTANSVDVQAPVFNSITQTRYTVKKAEDGSEFIPEEVIGKITATDDTDGNVEVTLMHNSVNLADDGEYQVIYSATDRAGNTAYLVIVVTVDGMAPVFDENTENIYYVYKNGTIFDSKHNAVQALPKTLLAKEAPGAYKGIGVYITTDQSGNIIFINTVKDTPAEEAIQINDILVGIDGEDLNGKTQEYAASKIRGEEGTTVTLDILRNGEKVAVTVERKLIKMYGEIDCTAEPDIDIDTINEKNGTIEITYTATDEIGNTAEFVITVIIVEDEDDKIVENENGKESEDLYNVTTSGNPPEGINLNIDEIESAEVDEEKVDEEAENEVEEETIENQEETLAEENIEE